MAKLIEGNRDGWNIPLLQQMFGDVTCEVTRKILITWRPYEDKMVVDSDWKWGKHYNVKA